MLRFRSQLSFLFILLLASLLAASCSPAAAPTPVLVTVVQTVPVEVTRQAEVTREVEVTRQVVATQLVEVTVTPPLAETPVQGIPMTQTPTQASPAAQTPAQGIPMTQTPTPANPGGQPATTSVVTPYNQITPDQKGQGFTPVFVQNETEFTMKVSLLGPTSLLVTVSPGGSQKVWLRPGDYLYETWKDDRKSYSGSFKIASADKHLLILRDSKAILWIP